MQSPGSWAVVAGDRYIALHVNQPNMKMRNAPRKNPVWPTTPAAGVCLHLTSLPGPYGIGEIGSAAFDFIDSLRKMGLRVWQFLPAGPTGFGDSPYQSLSSFAGNEMLIDVAALVDDGLLQQKDADLLRGLSPDAVDFPQLIPKKTAIVAMAASRFAGCANAMLKAAYDTFREDHDASWLNDYAIFQALKNEHGQRPWTEWAAPFKFRDSTALSGFESSSRHVVENLKIRQFLFYRQWQRLRSYAHEQGVLLFGDLPFYVSTDSVDAWTSRELLCIDDDGSPRLVAGVPPDYFSEDGQLWGNPVYDWPAHAANRYQWWISRLRHAMAQADLVRIDHFRGFDSYWAVPSGAVTAKVGEWLAGPKDAFFNAVRGALGLDAIVAEDLGMITPEVELLRKRHGIPGMKVLQFEVARDDFDLADIEADCVCYTGTHDSDTTRGWLQGSPGDTRKRSEIRRTRTLALRACEGTVATIHCDIIRLAFASAARLAIAPMQDYLGLGSEARLNKPGSTDKNWRWRLQANEISDTLLADVREKVSLAGRDS